MMTFMYKMPKRKRSYTPSAGAKKMRKYTKKFKRRSQKSLATRVKRVESLVNKTIENKHMDYTATATNGEQIYAASPVSKLAFIRTVLGADDDDRIGDKITLMSQRFMMNLKKGENSFTTGNDPFVKNNDQQVRVLIVENIGYDSTTDLQLTDVLEHGDFTNDRLTVFTSPYKLGAQATKRYRVLYDKVFHLHNDRPFAKIDFTKRYGTKANPGKVLTYENGASVFPSNHRLNCFAVSDYVTGTHPPLISIDVRSRYKDA